MLLGAVSEDHSTVELLDPPSGSRAGERVTFVGYQQAASPLPDITEEQKQQFIEGHMKTNSLGVATFKGIAFQTSSGVCTVPSLKNVLVA